MTQKISVLKAFAIAYQLLKAVDAVHDAKLMHRDIKPANILLNGKQVLLCDFGQCRVDMSKLQLPDHEAAVQGEQEKSKDEDDLKQQHKKLTLEVGSRWYKSPEILFGDRNYNQKLDMWQTGCVIAELAIACVETKQLGYNGDNPSS